MDIHSVQTRIHCTGILFRLLMAYNVLYNFYANILRYTVSSCKRYSGLVICMESVKVFPYFEHEQCLNCKNGIVNEVWK